MGESGIRELGDSASPSLFGIVRDKPLAGNGTLRGVVGCSRAKSSFDVRRSGSLNAGEGDSCGFGASERDRGFGVAYTVFVVFVERGVFSPSS